jgi:outer membrane protein TolC
MIALLLLATQIVSASAEPPLTVNDYLLQVHAGHKGVKAAELTADGARLYLDEANLQLRPVLNVNAESSSDDKPNPLFSVFSQPGGPQYDGVITRTLAAGVTEQTPYGVTGKVSYSINTLEYPGLSPEFIAASPAINVTASLWRNFLGREIDAQVDAQVAMSKAKELNQKSIIDNSLLEAENAYWRLALARESEAISTAAVTRAKKLYDFSEHRERLQLVDRSDPLQAIATLKSRELELKTAHDESRSARLAFNLARGTVNDEVPEKLEPLTPEIFEHMKTPERVGSRYDVLSTEEQLKVSQNQALSYKERNKPTLEVYGTYALNSQELNTGTAVSKSFDLNLPTRTIGLRFMTPLDFGTIQNVQAGYNQEAQAQELLLERKRQEQERDWVDLSKRFVETKDRLALAVEVEKVQLEKLNFEKSRHLKGRTTLKQVLDFENDYYNAEEQRVRTLTDLLNILAQMKLYGGRS